jgi:prepilin-type N-terminal cleavage/methylation domain-containing protein
MKILHALPARSRARSAFTVLEMLIAITLLGLLAASLSEALQTMRGLSNASNTQSRIQDAAEHALRIIVDDLKRSGFVSIAGTPYPYLFDDGAALAPFGGHAHAPVVKDAVAGDTDFGPNREIVFLQPLDADANDIPDIDANGDLIWDPTEFSYTVRTAGDGVNYLQRRANAAAPRTIASHIERIAFDDNTSSGNTLPMNAVRVRIYFRKVDAKGVLHRYAVESICKLRNGI